MLTGFYAYPSKPSSAGDSVVAAIDEINGAGEIKIIPWSQMAISGKVLISEICKQIDNADVFFADITDLNPNVLFELGYAVAKNKRVWLTLDTTYRESNEKLNQFRMLTTVGYASYQNSTDIVREFYKERPHDHLEETLLTRSIVPSINGPESPPATLLLLKGKHETEASLKIAKRAEHSRLGLTIDDPRESPIQPLTWYGARVFLASALICHLTNPDRQDAAPYNARSSLVAGMAHAMQKPVLMLIEGNYLSPIDYRDLAYNYPNAGGAAKYLDTWLSALEKEQKELESKRNAYLREASLLSQLKSLQVGEYIAEYESEKLIDAYFVETTAYTEAFAGQHSFFVGRKGSGKSATFLKLKSALLEDRRNVVAWIKPVAYDVQAVVRLLMQVKERDVRGFAIESLWKYLLLSEIANTIAKQVESRDGDTHTTEEKDLLLLMNRPGERLRDPFAERLERKVEAYSRAESMKDSISEDLHRGILKSLRNAILGAVESKRRIAILVDNLDLAWDKGEDMESLSQIVLGLLGAARSLADDLRRENRHAGRLVVSLAIFLRSDIFDRVAEFTPEPDKLNYQEMIWNDRQLLGRVIDERLIASQGGQIIADEIWQKFFTANVAGIPAREYFLNVVLPRPRDLVFFVKSAITTAVNRGRARVEEDDILEAEHRYSQFAVEILKVENSSTSSAFDDVVLSFVGAGPVVSRSTVDTCLRTAGVGDEKLERIVHDLVSLAFLGFEVRSGHFDFAHDPSNYRRLAALARRVTEQSGANQRFCIHPAFWSYLEVSLPSDELVTVDTMMRR